MIIIKIKTDNAAFHEYPGAGRGSGAARLEAARILKGLALKLETGSLNSPKLLDYNGNAVGEVILTGRERSWL